ncbi:hypothetical protein LJR220_001935 [Bradyrhizobium sp. LjRoot220]|uniref:hypothetical protein n=1 Tax=Bradyrhizobium sp. LjRoot220 TaxID=3342284 RepID=UPI003ECE431E
MTIFSDFGFRGGRRRLVNTQAFALEQLVSIHCVTSDLRWAMVELAWRSFTAMCRFAQAQLLAWAHGHRAQQQEEDGRGRHCCC